MEQTGVKMAENLSDLYSDYYEDAPNPKREIAARDSVDHIIDFHPEPLGSVVDVGAGNGSVIGEIARRGIATDVSALEISASGIERIQARQLAILKEVKPFDGYRMPYPNDNFDSAVCIHVLEHVEHERIFLKELARIARDVFIEIPLEGGFRGRINYTYGHINYYSPLSFLALVETSGLRIVKSKIVTSSLAYEQFVHGKVPGAVRAAARRGLLSIAGKRASDLMTYLMVAHCRRSD